MKRSARDDGIMEGFVTTARLAGLIGHPVLPPSTMAVLSLVVACARVHVKRLS